MTERFFVPALRSLLLPEMVKRGLSSVRAVAIPFQETKPVTPRLM